MASPKLSVRLDPQLYTTLVKLAQVERKTVTEMTAELLELGIGRKQTPESAVLDEMRLANAQMAELVARTLKASAGARYFSRLAVTYAQDMTQYLAALAQNVNVDQGSNQKLMAQFEQKSKEFEKHYLEDPFEKI